MILVSKLEPTPNVRNVGYVTTQWVCVLEVNLGESQKKPVNISRFARQANVVKGAINESLAALLFHFVRFIFR